MAGLDPWLIDTLTGTRVESRDDTSSCEYGHYRHSSSTYGYNDDDGFVPRFG